jgi:hypothetical protein
LSNIFKYSLISLFNSSRLVLQRTAGHGVLISLLRLKSCVWSESEIDKKHQEIEDCDIMTEEDWIFQLRKLYCAEALES